MGQTHGDCCGAKRTPMCERHLRNCPKEAGNEQRAGSEAIAAELRSGWGSASGERRQRLGLRVEEANFWDGLLWSCL